MLRYLAVVCFMALGIGLACSSVGAHGSADPSPAPPEAASAVPLTGRLAELARRWQAADLSSRGWIAGQVVAAARARRQRLEALIDEHPGEVLRATLSAQARALVPAVAVPLLEEPAAEEGVVEVLHVDGAGGTARDRYLHTLETARGRFPLRLAGRLPDLLTGDRIRVRGVRLGLTLAADGDTGVTLLAAATAATLGDQSTLVIALNFSDTPGAYTSASVDQLRQVVFLSGSSVSNYFREASYGRTWLSGVVVGPYAISMGSGACDPMGLSSLARQRATAAGVNWTQYRRLVYAFPRNGCSWGGLGTVGGNPSQAWANGSFSGGLIAHELGHGFGLYHSHSLECGSVTIGGGCSSLDYGDTLDVMGYSSASYHFNAAQKERLAWLDATGAPPITHVQASGVYTLTPYEANTPGAKALKLALPNGDRYYLEYRQPIGFDASIPPSVRNGVVVHLWRDLDPDGMFLLDMTPATTSWLDPALPVGQTFTDAASSISLTPVWATSSDAGVNVSLGGGSACTRVNPSIAATPSAAQGPAGSLLTYSVAVTNRDSGGCPASTFALTATGAAGWSVVLGAGPLTVGGGATAAASLQVTSPMGALAGAVSIAVAAVDTTAPARTAATSVTYTVAATAAGTMTDEFNRPGPALGNGWSQAAGQFVIQDQEARNAATAGVHMAVLPALNGADQVAQVTFTRDGAVGAPRFGLLLRYQNPANYYACYRQAGASSRLRLVRVAGGVETVLAQVSVKNPSSGRPFNLTCRAEGTALTAILGGGPTITAGDATFAGGSVGMLMGQASGAGSTRAHRADHWSASVE